MPAKAAEIIPALKFPLASLATIVFAVLEDVAEVALFKTLPAVAIVANFVSVIFALAVILLLSIAPLAIVVLKVPVPEPLTSPTKVIN